MSDDNYHDKLDKIQRDIDWIVQYLLKKDQPLRPPPYVPTYPHTDETYPKTCSRCGIRLDQVMGYVCNDSQCPTFMKVTSVSFGTKSTEGYNG